MPGKFQLFDEFVGGGEQRCWHSEAKRLGSLEIDDQLVFGRRLHRKIGRLLALEDAVDIACCTTVLVDKIRSIGNQSPGSNKGSLVKDRRKLVLRRQLDDHIAKNVRG